MRCHSPRRTPRSRGVTLLEMVIVLSITAIIAGAVAVFITRPVESYADATRRAELTDIADTALRRMARDLRTALPNSIRITAVETPPASGNFIVYLEFLQTSGGGRYRAQADSGGLGDPLDFNVPDSTFDVIGTVPTFAGGETIVIYNLSNNGTVANAYDPASSNRATHLSDAGGVITLAAAVQFRFPSPGNRFQVVQYPVTYECNPIAGTQQLRRYWGYAIAPAQPLPPVTANVALLASDVLGCSFTYDAVGARNGLVRLQLRIERDGEVIQLFQQVHVSNVP
jgi:MSHA biogenesis protein MshO